MKVAATELVAGLSGESEERIREVFENAKNSAPIVLFLDEIDAIAPHRANAQREMERRIVAQLLVSMDGNLIKLEHAPAMIIFSAQISPQVTDK